jgi:hypothetical protein
MPPPTTSVPQRLRPHEKFGKMFDRQCDSVAAYCRPQNEPSLGFEEGLHNQIRDISEQPADCPATRTCGSKSTLVRN